MQPIKILKIENLFFVTWLSILWKQIPDKYMLLKWLLVMVTDLLGTWISRIFSHRPMQNQYSGRHKLKKLLQRRAVMNNH